MPLRGEDGPWHLGTNEKGNVSKRGDGGVMVTKTLDECEARDRCREGGQDV